MHGKFEFAHCTSKKLPDLFDFPLKFGSVLRRSRGEAEESRMIRQRNITKRTTNRDLKKKFQLVGTRINCFGPNARKHPQQSNAIL
jgi:hypothetical protein